MVVANATPLIHLSRAGYLNLLQRCFIEIEIPKAVYHEVVTKGKERRRADTPIVEKAISEGWIKVVNLDEDCLRFVENLLRIEKIGLGEAQAIALALKMQAPLITDDKVVHRFASMYRVETLWTTTLILNSVNTRLLGKEEGKQVLRELIRTGCRLKTEVYDALLRRIDEL